MGDDCIQNKCLLLKIKVLVLSDNFIKEEKQSEFSYLHLSVLVGDSLPD